MTWKKEHKKKPSGTAGLLKQAKAITYIIPQFPKRGGKNGLST